MAETPPEGIVPLFLRPTTAQNYGLKTGEAVLDVVDRAMLKKADLVAEIQLQGVMSDFASAKAAIAAFPDEELLIYSDKQQKYGELWLLVVTTEARERMRVEEAAVEAAARAEQESLERELMLKAEEEERKRNVVYVDEPFVARAWVSTTMDATCEEIKITELADDTQHRVCYDVYRPKRSLNHQVAFHDRLADNTTIDIRSHKHPPMTFRKEADLGIQVTPACEERSAQTTWRQTVNASVQYEPMRLAHKTSTGTGDDDDMFVRDPVRAVEYELTTNRRGFLQFLESTSYLMEMALQQNETIDIFADLLAGLGDDDQLEGPRAENDLREIKNFADPTYSKSKLLTHIDWLPRRNDVVAVSAVRNMNFDERVGHSGMTSTSFILLWDFAQLVRPSVLVQSPGEIFTFKFNPSQPDWMAGGTLTGQVVFWDISDHLSAVTRKQRANSVVMSRQASTVGEEAERSVPTVKPACISHINYSHKRPVADLFWLKPDTQVNYKGQLVASEYSDGRSYQFVTVAADGMAMIWDIRYEAIANDELRHIGRPKHMPVEKVSRDGIPVPVWAPIFKMHLKRLEGVGELSLCKLCMPAQLQSEPASVESRSQFFTTTEEGDLVFADWMLRGGTQQDDDEDMVESRELVRWLTKDNSRPANSLEMSPFLPDLLLSVSDWSFNIWKVGAQLNNATTRTPVFSSPITTTPYTCGSWSPTRPGVLVVSCADGSLQVWDFTDSSYRPSIEFKATHTRITVMEFLRSSNAASQRQQLLAIGDEAGTLHVFEMPRNLLRPVHHEKQIFANFIDREIKRHEFLSNQTGQEDHAQMSEAHASNQTNIPTRETVGTDDNLETYVLSEEELKHEEQFVQVEAMFIKELGLEKDELPDFAKEWSIDEMLNHHGSRSSLRTRQNSTAM